MIDSARRRQLSTPISYVRIGEGSETTYSDVPATLGTSTRDTIDADGVVFRHELRDFLILASDLPVTPQAGDEIRLDLEAGNAQRFEVYEPPGVPVWEWEGEYQTTYRIHTRIVEGGTV